MPIPIDTALTLRRIEDLFQTLTCTLLGIDNIAHPSAVRISWPTGGAPAWKITDDVIFLQVIEISGPYNRQREVLYEGIWNPVLDESSGEAVVDYISGDPVLALDEESGNQVTHFTRIMQVSWTLYGPNSFDRAQTIRDAFFYQENHNALALQNIYLIPDDREPRRIPELFQGQWWERVDFTMDFNELIIRNLAVPYIQTAEITTIVDSPPTTDIVEVTQTTPMHN